MLTRYLLPACLLVPMTTWAAPNEIKVFSDELAAYGEHTLETHVNKASRAGRNNDNTAAPLQVMPEYSYGLWKNWEFSLQLPVAAQQQQIRSNGFRVELQYIAPHDESSGFYWGYNLEAARLMRNGERQFWNIELIPILGYRHDRWHLIANPGVGRPLTGTDRRVTFEPATKIAYRASGNNHFGFEYYAETGPIRRFSHRDQQSRVLYFAWDGKIGKSDINIGIGRGLTNASDRMVFKTIVEFSY